VVKALWAIRADGKCLTDVTLFTPAADADEEHTFLENLDTIDLHHGPYSTSKPYTVLEAVGVTLSIDVEDALKALGFNELKPLATGFRACRSDAEAQRLRRDGP
jgi:hypothetical protein